MFTSCIPWNELRKLAGELNTIISPVIKEENRPAIALQGAGRQYILEAIRYWRDYLAEHPEWVRENIPPHIIEFWGTIEETGGRGNDLFFKTDISFVKEGKMRELSGSALKVLMAFMAHASFSEDNRGETFVGLETVAKLSGVSFRNIHLYVRELQDKGYLVNIDKRKVKDINKFGSTMRRIVSFKN